MELSVAAGVVHVDGTKWVRVAGGEGVQRAEVRLDEHGLEAEAGRLDSGDDAKTHRIEVLNHNLSWREVLHRNQRRGNYAREVICRFIHANYNLRRIHL